MLNSIGVRLKEARVERGLTQAQLASGLATKGFISLIERDRARASLPKLRLLAERLGRPLSYFIEDAPTNLAYVRKAAELALRANEPSRAVAIISEGVPLASTANERADLMRLQGMGLAMLARADEAMTRLELAAATAPPDDPDLNAAIYAELGKLHGIGERFNASAEANLRALGYLDQSRHPDLDLRARLLTNLASDCYSLGRLSQATAYYEQALEVATDAESLLRMAHSHMALGVSYRAQGDLTRALEHCDRALEMHRRLGQTVIANQILNNLGDVHFAAGRFEEARSCQMRCLTRAQELEDPIGVAAAMGELARYALHDGMLDDALRFAQQGQVAARRADDHLTQAKIAAVEGGVLEKLGRQGAADLCFQKAFRLLRRRKAAGKLADVCASYSDLLRERGDTEGALTFMRVAYERGFDRLPGLIRQRHRLERRTGRSRGNRV